MKMHSYKIALRRDTRRGLSLECVAACADIHPALIDLLMEYDLIRPLEEKSEQDLVFEVSVVPRLKMIQRLRCDLGINLAGVAVILDMLDRMKELQRENKLLRTR